VTAFEDFIALQERVRRDDPTVLQLGETRIARALSSLRPSIRAPEELPRLHRCHLATAWCARRGMPAEWSARALVCEGVRHALALIFGELARRDEVVAVPSDVYPVYGQLAAGARLATVPIETFPALTFDTPARYLLLPCPLKLHGRAWSAAELATAAAWLAADRTRRLIFDGVYSFDARLAPAVRALIETDQVIYLDSLSKSWLHEKVFGTAVVPAQDFAAWAPIFRAAAPAQTSLFVARTLLEHAVPVAAELELRRTRTLAALAERGITAAAPSSGYLIPIELAAQVALAHHRVLVIPFAVFGGSRPWSFASAL
jgi:DNA-binding transcriptional MocR family regulator